MRKVFGPYIIAQVKCNTEHGERGRLSHSQPAKGQDHTGERKGSLSVELGRHLC